MKYIDIKSSHLVMPVIVILTCLIQVGCSQIHTSSAVDLEKGFKSPPDSAKPHTWCHYSTNTPLMESGMIGPVKLINAVIRETNE